MTAGLQIAWKFTILLLRVGTVGSHTVPCVGVLVRNLELEHSLYDESLRNMHATKQTKQSTWPWLRALEGESQLLKSPWLLFMYHAHSTQCWAPALCSLLEARMKTCSCPVEWALSWTVLRFLSRERPFPPQPTLPSCPQTSIGTGSLNFWHTWASLSLHTQAVPLNSPGA